MFQIVLRIWKQAESGMEIESNCSGRGLESSFGEEKWAEHVPSQFKITVLFFNEFSFMKVSI